MGLGAIIGIISAAIAAAGVASSTATSVSSNKHARKQSRLAEEQSAAQQRVGDTEALDQSLNAEVENDEQEENNVNDAIDNQETETTNQSGEEEEQKYNGRFKRGGKVSMNRTRHNKIFSCGGRRKADYGTNSYKNKKSGKGADIAAGIFGGLSQMGQAAMNWYNMKQQDDILKKLGSNTTSTEDDNTGNNNDNTSNNVVTATSNSLSNGYFPDYATAYANRNKFAVNDINKLRIEYPLRAGGRFANRSYIRTTKRCC